VREGRGTINRDIQNCLGRIGLNLLRPINLTFARSISNIGFAVRAVRGCTSAFARAGGGVKSSMGEFQILW